MHIVVIDSLLMEELQGMEQVCGTSLITSDIFPSTLLLLHIPQSFLLQ